MLRGRARFVAEAQAGEPPERLHRAPAHADRRVLERRDKQAEDCRHDGEHSDRYERPVEITSGWQEIRIPLSEVAAAPQTRRMDLSRIKKLQFFAVRPPQRRTLHFDDLRLE